MQARDRGAGWARKVVPLAQHESIRIGLQGIAEAQQLFGQQDSFLRLLESRFPARLLLRSDSVEVVGAPEVVPVVVDVVAELLEHIRAGRRLQVHDVKMAIRSAREHRQTEGGDAADATALRAEDERPRESRSLGDVLPISSRRGPIRPRSPMQTAYIEAMRTHDLVFAVGPAGTGKTYLAMAVAASALRSGHVDRIIMTRPAVEAGEKLGFLPGDLQAKIDPYLRPLYDALYDMFPHRTVVQFIERGVIEVAPLAFMRGRTLNRSFVVLDEAQNATIAQMKMFLTRLGFDSKAVVTGDVTQSDLPTGAPPGLVDAVRVLAGVEGISIVEFTSADVVRNELVQRIVEAYSRAGARSDAGVRAPGPEEEREEVG
jgi:phosphate starvation-inducible PhoH-like protein